MVAAVADLCVRLGASPLNVGHDENADLNGPADWYASTNFLDRWYTTRGHRSSASACYVLAAGLVVGIRCACGLMVVLDPGPHLPSICNGPNGERLTPNTAAIQGLCLWEQLGERWVAGCDLLPVGDQPEELGTTHALTG